jgi:triosephosphate isomerase
MNKQFVAGNWKMNLTLVEARDLATKLCDALANSDAVDVGVFPSYVFLNDICEILSGSNVTVGAQNMNQENSGAFTGEVSGPMLRDVGCTHVIIGHSERRIIFHETNSMINLKIKAALSYSLSPIFCVGEKQEERDANRTNDVIGCQLSDGLEGLTTEQVKELTIAYEPVWAIGTGKTASPEQANEVHAFIRNTIESKYDNETAKSIRIQYGGSVNPKNVRDLLGQPEIDGALVGGASLEANSFLEIISAAAAL